MLPAGSNLTRTFDRLITSPEATLDGLDLDALYSLLGIAVTMAAEDCDSKSGRRRAAGLVPVLKAAVAAHRHADLQARQRQHEAMCRGGLDNFSRTSPTSPSSAPSARSSPTRLTLNLRPIPPRPPPSTATGCWCPSAPAPRTARPSAAVCSRSAPSTRPMRTGSPGFRNTAGRARAD